MKMNTAVQTHEPAQRMQERKRLVPLQRACRAS